VDSSPIFNYLQDHIKRKLINLLIAMPFWVIPFILFKRSFFTIPIYAQLSLIFCLCLSWYILNVFLVLIITSGFLEKTERIDELIPEIITFSSICSISILILIGYYFSLSLTSFLVLAFISILLLKMVLIFIFLLKSVYYSLRKS